MGYTFSDLLADSSTAQIVIISIITIPLCLIATGLRLLATKRSSRKFGWDDAFSIFALIGFLVYACAPFIGESFILQTYLTQASANLCSYQAWALPVTWMIISWKSSRPRYASASTDHLMKWLTQQYYIASIYRHTILLRQPALRERQPVHLLLSHLLGRPEVRPMDLRAGSRPCMLVHNFLLRCHIPLYAHIEVVGRRWDTAGILPGWECFPRSRGDH